MPSIATDFKRKKKTQRKKFNRIFFYGAEHVLAHKIWIYASPSRTLHNETTSV